MVQLNVAVTDKKGNYITGLRPQDFIHHGRWHCGENGHFRRGRRAAHRGLRASAPSDLSGVAGDPVKGSGKRLAHSADLASLVAGANVFVLFDTSNYMYRGFVFAQDAITEFVRSLGDADKIAFYSYSRDLSRSARRLRRTGHRFYARSDRRVAGDEAALYNAPITHAERCRPKYGKKSSSGILERPR